jgi:WD40 repeat protein
MGYDLLIRGTEILMMEKKSRGYRPYRLQEGETDQVASGLSRRAFLMGGLAGVALPGSALFTGCGLTPSRQVVTVPRKQDSHLVFAMSWQGLDFAWLPDSTRLAYVSDRELFVVDRQSGRRVQYQQTWPHADHPAVQVISWSADGTCVASLASTALLQTGQTIWSYQDDRLSTLITSLSPDGTLLALAQSPPVSSNMPPATVQIWHLREGRLISQYVKPVSDKKLTKISSIVWSPDSTRVASTSQDGSVQLWRVSDGHLLWAYNSQTVAGPREVLSWSPDGSALAFSALGTRGQTLLGIWDARTGQTRFQMPAIVSYPASPDQRNKQVTWSPDGARIAFETQDRAGSLIVVSSVQSGQQLFACQRVSGQPTYVTWSPDGKYLAAGNTLVDANELAGGDNGDRSVIQFWDTYDGRALFTYSAPKSPNRLRWSPDGRYLALITPRLYDILPNKTCLSLCRYGYEDYALEVFQMS